MRIPVTDRRATAPPREPVGTGVITSVGTALVSAADALRAASPTPRLDAEVLLAHVLERERSWLLAHPEESMPVHAQRLYAQLVERRTAGEPVAYLRGFKEWRSLRIRTDSRALIPRPETELLLDVAIDEIRSRMARDDRSLIAWEVGCGSGALVTALALRFREAIALGRVRLIASDVSADALELTAENLDAHGVAPLVDLALADLLAPAGASLPKPDVTIANLPYLPTDEVAAAGGSLAFEPTAALDGGPDGLDVVRRLLAQVPLRTAEAATVLLEIGAGQAEAVAMLAPHRATVEMRRDLAGIERVVRIGLADSAA
jgi:release factor glutamine methyltransferase